MAKSETFAGSVLLGDVGLWHDEVDVLVVGLGCAGACAAIEAARAGAKVLVAEKASFGGGTSSLSGGVLYCGGGTRIQHACGFSDSVQAMVDYLTATCGPSSDEEKIRLYCERSVEHFDWLESLGIPFKASFWPEYTEPHSDDGLYFSGCEHAHPYREIAPAAPRGHVVQAMGSVADPATIGAGRILMDVLEKELAGAGAATLFGASLEALVQDGDGRVWGAQFRLAGETRWIRASRGVVLTTGGFMGNRAMLEAHAPAGLSLVPLIGAHDEGDGIRIGRAAGGATLHMEALAIMCPVLEPHSLVRGILFNREGVRFVSEDVNHKRIAERAFEGEGGRIYLLVDDEIYCEPRFPKPLIATGNTVEELEAQLAFLPTGRLRRLVRDYNEHAAAGRDPLLGKCPENLRPLDKPPYGVFDCSLGEGQPYLGLTLGGLETKSTGEVIARGGGSVAGLFAAGRVTSCLSAQTCFASGIQLGEGSFFGRLAGLQAAQ